MAATLPIFAFMSFTSAHPVTLSQLIRERAIDIVALQKRVSEAHWVIPNTLHANRERDREAAEPGQLMNFSEGDFVLVAREEFNKDEKLCLRWRDPRRVTKAISNYVYQVEDLRNGALSDVHA